MSSWVMYRVWFFELCQHKVKSIKILKLSCLVVTSCWKEINGLWGRGNIIQHAFNRTALIPNMLFWMNINQKIFYWQIYLITSGTSLYWDQLFNWSIIKRAHLKVKLFRLVVSTFSHSYLNDYYLKVPFYTLIKIENNVLNEIYHY